MRAWHLGQVTMILPLPRGTESMVPQLGHLRNAFSLRSFHIFLATRACRLRSLAEEPADDLALPVLRPVLPARELMSDPKILIFDEPCTGLDPEGMYHVRETMSLLAAEGRSVVLVTHYPEDIIPAIDRVLLIKDAEVFADGPKAELMRDDVLSELFGVPLEVEEHNGWYALRGKY